MASEGYLDSLDPRRRLPGGAARAAGALAAQPINAATASARRYGRVPRSSWHGYRIISRTAARGGRCFTLQGPVAE